jgi:aldose 1-epimerase
MQPSITEAPFGQLPEGGDVQHDVTEYTLTNADGMIVKILNLGGIITEIHVPDRDGRLADVVCSFDDVASYLGESHYFGALIGRYGNRIANARFTLDGQQYDLDQNNGANHLHGGVDGFHRRLWTAETFSTPKSAGLILSYLSADGEQGYPGNLDTTVIYELRADNELRIAFHAVTDQATPVNLTNHAYFNLAAGGDILGHELTIHADRYTPIDNVQIPLGELPPVAGTPFDFQQPHTIGERIDADDEQIRNGFGYDHNFVLAKKEEGALTLAARVREPGSGRVLEVWSQEPGIQFYSGNFLSETVKGKGRIYGYRNAFCLEPQHFPDSPNRLAYPSTILRPGDEYSTVMAYKFTTD